MIGRHFRSAAASCVLCFAAVSASPGSALAQDQRSPDQLEGPAAQRQRQAQMIEEFTIGNEPRYLVTYMNSQVAGRTRSATVVSVTNQAPQDCRVTVAYFKGLGDNSAPVCTSTVGIPPEFTIDFCSRSLPTGVTACNATCRPELTFDEGRAIVAASCREIGLSARVYYTSGGEDEEVAAITDSKIVRFKEGNHGD